MIMLLIILVGVGSLFLLRSDTKTEERKTITIGATLPLSGGLAFLGESYRDAMLMALEEEKVKGNLKYDYKIIFEDDQFNPALAASTVNKLVAIDHVDALTSFGSPVGNVVSPIAEKHQIVHINGIASDPAVAKGDYNFVHWTPPYEEVQLLIAEFKRRNIKNVVLFEQNQPGVLAVTTALREQLKGTGIKLIVEEKFTAGETDFRSLINKAKINGAKADIYLLEATSPELEILAKQIKAAGITKSLTSIESFEFTDTPALFEGNWYVNAADQQAWFVDVYTKKYARAPKLGAGNGYDSVKMLIAAFEETGNSKTKPAGEKVRNALASLKNYQGAMGDKLSVDTEGIVVTKPIVKIISGGKAINVK